MRSLVIVNPEAGGLPDRGEFESALETLGDVRVLEAESPGEARTLAARASEGAAGQVVAAGGDGTVNQVVNGILSSGAHVRLGILPVGTGNDFARSLGLPMNLRNAVKLIAGTGTPRRVDAVRMVAEEPRFFANLAVGGVGGRVHEQAGARAKSRWGRLAYLLEAAEELPEIEAYQLRIECDEDVVEREAMSLILANGTTSAGGIRVAPAARLDDGLLDVILIPFLRIPELAGLVPRILAGKHAEDDRVVARRCRHVRVESDPPMPFRADGEEVGVSPLELEVRPGCLAVATGDP